MNVCVVCDRKAIARGYCDGHYARWKRGVEVNVPLGPARSTGPRLKGPARFWSKVNKTDTCWLWAGSEDEDGYGVFTMQYPDGRKYLKAHRVAFRMTRGWVPPRDSGLEVRHICGPNPACVRPDHLAVGTAQQNAQDAQQHGTRGKLSVEDAAVIRALLAAGTAQTLIAHRFGVTPAVITGIKQGKIHRS